LVKPWEAHYYQTPHWICLYLLKKNGCLAKVLDQDDNSLWAWIGIGFDTGNLTVAVDTGGKPELLLRDTGPFLKKFALEEVHHESSGAWGAREWYRSWPTDTHDITNRDKLISLLKSPIKIATDFLSYVEQAGAS
jgi:hypothetical protein